MTPIAFTRAVIGAALTTVVLSAAAQVPTDPYTYTKELVIERDPVTGFVTAEVVQPNHPQLCLRTEYSYDVYGNRKTTTAKNCSGATGTALIATRLHVDDYAAQGETPAGLVPTVVTNSESQVARWQIDSRYGRVKVATDVNGLTTSVTYDDFGRRTLEVRPDGNKTAWVYGVCTTVGGPDTSCSGLAADSALLAYYVRATPLNSSGQTNGSISTTFFDTEDRPVRVETQAYGAGAMRTRVMRYRYDTLGRLDRETGPYFEGDTPSEWVERTYDALGRVTAETRPNPSAAGGLATAAVAYNGRLVTQTNPLGQTLTKERNEYDRVIRVTDSQGNQISFQHDAFGNIARVRDPLGNVTTLTYDLRGRKVGVDDPNMGVWTYEVDVIGQMVKQTSPKSLVVTSTYDRIGRLTRRLEADLDTSWYFDKTVAGQSCGASVNMLCEVTTTTGYRRLHTYDALGRVTRTSTTLMSGTNGTFVNKIDYNSDGRIWRQTWPTGFAIDRSYNSQGVLVSLQNAANGVAYWQRVENNARGEFVAVSTGNGLVTRTTWQPETGNVVALQTGTVNSPAAVVNHTYGYNALNNLTARADLIQALNETFAYDNLNRVTTQTLRSPTSTRDVIYKYDALGNVTYNSDVGVYTYTPTGQGAGPSRPHAVRSITGRAGKLSDPVYTYDLHGNIEQVSGANGVTRTHVWTSFDMPQSLALSQDGVSTTFLYGPEHQRVRQTIVRNGQTRTVLYLHPNNEGALYFERELQGTGGVATNRHYVEAEGGAFLQVETPGAIPADPVATNLSGQQMRYWHKDHLGSITAVTDGVGSTLERLAYEPFGKRRQINGAHDATGAIDALTTKRGFTGHEHLDEVDYIHMNGRIYDPDIARFLSPDPTVPYFHHLQSFNRYSYTRNNPLNRVDPNGFDDGDANAGAASADTPSLGNSLSKAAVSKAIGDMAGGKATSPGQQGNTKGANAPAGEAGDAPDGRIGLSQKAKVGNDIAKGLEWSLWEGFTTWATGPLGKLAGLFGTKAVTTGAAAKAAAIVGFSKKGAVAEKAAEKTVQAAVNETRQVTHQLERVEITMTRAVPHGNSMQNMAPHHRYVIRKGDDVVKTGISSSTLNLDGTSKRANIQVNKLNKAAGSNEYSAEVAEVNMPGRKAALASEQKATTELDAQGHSLNLMSRPKP